jgi:hypothetical protein
MMDNLAEAYPKEQARCSRILEIYKSIPTGWFGVLHIEATLREANEAAASGDLVAMIRAYEKMKSISE